jgi:hypothetical protein
MCFLLSDVFRKVNALWGFTSPFTTLLNVPLKKQTLEVTGMVPSTIIIIICNTSQKNSKNLPGKKQT